MNRRNIKEFIILLLFLMGVSIIASPVAKAEQKQSKADKNTVSFEELVKIRLAAKDENALESEVSEASEDSITIIESPDMVPVHLQPVSASPEEESEELRNPVFDFDNIERLWQILRESGNEATPQAEQMLKYALMNLDPDKAVAIGLALSPQMRIADANIKAAEGKYAEAQSGLNVKLEFNTQYIRMDPVAEVEMKINPDEPPQLIQFGNHNTVKGGLTLQKILTTFGQLENTVAALKLQIYVQEQDKERVRQEVILNVKSAYYNVLKAEGYLNIARQNRKILKDQLEITNNLYEEGVVPRFEVLRGELQLSQAEQLVVSGENAFLVSRASLMNVMGVGKDYPMKLNTTIDIKPITIDMEEAQKTALERRPEIKAAIILYDSLKLLVTAAKQGKSPYLVFTSSYERTTASSFGSSPNTFLNMLSLKIPILDGGETKAKVEQAEASLKQVESTLHQLYLGLRLEVSQSVLKLQEIIANMKAAQNDVITAEEGYNVALIRFENGLSTGVELDDARKRLNEARVNLTNVYYEYYTALAKLEKATAATWKGE